MKATAGNLTKRSPNLTLFLLFVAGCVFIWLASNQVLSFFEIRKVRGGSVGLFKVSFWTFAFLFLALSAWIGPIAYLMKDKARRAKQQKHDEDQRAK